MWSVKNKLRTIYLYRLITAIKSNKLKSIDSSLYVTAVSAVCRFVTLLSWAGRCIKCIQGILACMDSIQYTALLGIDRIQMSAYLPTFRSITHNKISSNAILRATRKFMKKTTQNYSIQFCFFALLRCVPIFIMYSPLIHYIINYKVSYTSYLMQYCWLHFN